MIGEERGDLGQAREDRGIGGLLRIIGKSLTLLSQGRPWGSAIFEKRKRIFKMIGLKKKKNITNPMGGGD